MSGNQAVQMVAAGLEGHLRQRLAGGRRRQQRRPDVSRPEPLPCRLGAQPGAPSEQCADARRPDPSLRRQERHQLVCAPDCRRGSRLRRHAECLRADEVDDRSGRGLRALRRSAFVGEEVRTPGRQSAGAHAGGGAEAGCGTSGGRRSGRAHADSGAHRRQQRAPADQRHRSLRPHLPAPASGPAEGFYGIHGGLDSAIARGLAYAPYAT